MNKRKIFDCFLFFNELDMLKMRFEELKDVVEIFVLVESRFTFSGQPKPLYFEQNKNRFKDYNVIHIIAEDSNSPSPWLNEHFQRTFPSKYLMENMKFNDLVCLCDLDEIPSPEVLSKIKKGEISAPGYLEMDLYYYNFNWIKKSKWARASIVTLDEIKSFNIGQIRSGQSQIQIIKDSGWHLSYFMSPELIQEKIKSFSHQEFNSAEYLDINNITKAIDSGLDLFKRGEHQDLVPRTTQTLPKNAAVLDKITLLRCSI